ncbi:transcriptional regulator [Acinetobacter venetianus]|uniref:AraC family transcriptional regulator n=1 Tax=Acinetobacter venetianus TaxID=52133 RepID=UPI000775A4B6|nr:AraC family transcriptional regulator [Acinetobacter venetianus]KXO87387.1 transcriptional regulator [Acinetobacter venetianus]
MSAKLPGTYVNLLVDALRARNLSVEQLLGDFDIEMKDIEAPFWYVNLNVFNELIDSSIILAEDRSLIIHMAKSMKASCYGHVGVAAVAAENLLQAIKILEKFIGLHCLVFKPVLKIKENKAYIFFDQSFISENLSNNGLLFSILGFASLIKDLLKTDIKIKANFKQYNSFNINNLLGFDCRFGQEKDCLIFDKALLENSLPTADEMVFRLLKEQCERDVKRQIIKKEKLNSTKFLVKELLHGSQDYSVNLNQVALELKTSVRSLQRQLASEETSFQIVLAEARREYAEKLLKSTRLSIQEISNILGYADISHFTRAFKKWVGLTPTIYRKA